MHLVARGQKVVSRRKLVVDVVLDRLETRLAASDLFGKVLLILLAGRSKRDKRRYIQKIHEEWYDQVLRLAQGHS
jgi:hypothetical protein